VMGFFSWRGLGWFWAAVLAIAITGVALLRTPLNHSEHPPAVRAASQPASPSDTITPSDRVLPVPPAGEKPPSDGRLSALLSRAGAQIEEDRLQLPPGDNATETLMEAFELLPRASLAELQRANALVVRFGQRARTAQSEQESDEAQQFSSETGSSAPSKMSSRPADDIRRRSEQELSIYYSPSSVLSASRAEELARRLGSRLHTELHNNTDLPQVTTVRFFSSADHSMARDVAAVLNDMGFRWRIENSATQAPISRRGTIEVWLSVR
jgi:hypothetical protein